MLDQDVLGAPERCGAWPAALMGLPKEVAGVETALVHPASKLSAQPAVVGLHPQRAQRIGDGGCSCDRSAQLVGGWPGRHSARSPLAGHVRDIDSEVIEAPEEMAAQLAVWPGAEEGYDLVDVRTLRGGFCQPFPGVLHAAAHEVLPLPRPR